MFYSQFKDNSINFRINELVENVFKFTLNKNCVLGGKCNQKTIVYLEEISCATGKQVIDLEILEHVLFERLLLEDPTSAIIGNDDNNIDDRTAMNECMTYLFDCYKDLFQYIQNLNDKNEEWNGITNNIIKLIIRNAATALRQPDLYPSQNIHAQVVNLFSSYAVSHSEELIKFFKEVVVEMYDNEMKFDLLCSVLNPIFDILLKDAVQGSILIRPVVCLDIVALFSKIPDFARAIVKHSFPTSNETGKSFADGLLGALFSISSLPKNSDSKDEYFDKVTIQNGIICKHLWTGLENLSVSLHRIVLSYLKSTEVRHDLLTWFGTCIARNFSRKQMWNHMMQQFTITESLNVSDGFALNLCSVLLRLCEPFVKPINNLKLLKIDPTYCSVELEADFEKKNVHLRKLYSETCLIPLDAENEKRIVAEGEYSFITECFFMTHSALELGVKTCFDKLINLNQEIGRMQEILQSERFLYNQDIRNIFAEKLQFQLIKYVSLRTALLEPSLINLLGNFHGASCVWLVQLLLDSDNSTNRETYAPLKYRKLTYPLPEPPLTLKCVPEFVFENLYSYLALLRKCHATALEEIGMEIINAILTTLIVYMSSNKFVRNPHLRARLAECIYFLLPIPAEIDLIDTLHENVTQINYFYRMKLFSEHSYRLKIIPSLLDVFVGIEMTGQSVQFEQKFNYRQPMYSIIKYLWTLPEQKEVFKELAVEAEHNMVAVNPPLFLRFINVLVNDAIFLLDEAFSNMAQLRQLQNALDNHEWDNLSTNERESNLQQLQHIGMIARFDNILGMSTITTLQYLTEEIKTIFYHAAMVDRVASMLNYFLVHLVGPKKKNFKVKDMDEYKFNPAAIVRIICTIYVNLANNDTFCGAISNDGRSYSPQLFKQATDVLMRVGGTELISDLENLSKRVAELASQQMTDEELLAGAPEDYLDPIMSTLMTDPVILPSSKITVDRTTIARHLLSDQTDPFNRSPLTMDMIQTNVELKQEIEKWMLEKRKALNSSV